MTELRFERVHGGLTFPTAVAFGDDGAVYVAESGLPFGGAPPGGRVLCLDDGRVLADGLRAPVTGLTWHDGALLLSEGGHPAALSRLALDGARHVIVDGFTGPGNYHLGMAVPGPDGFLYFAVGAMTNTGVIGLDAYEVGWLRRVPHAWDVPGLDIVLAGESFESEHPTLGHRRTGAFAPFGEPGPAGVRITGQPRCTASVMRCRPDGRELTCVTWGLRNAYGLGFLADGRLIALDQGADDRGSRPVGDVPDYLWHVRPGAWYGWPDFLGGVAITDPRFTPRRGPPPRFVLANHAELPPPERPLVALPPHVSATRFAVAPPSFDDLAGALIVTLFGDERPMTAPDGPRAGRALAAVDLAAADVRMLDTPPLARPVDVVAHGDALHVLDFGAFEMAPGGAAIAEPGSGALWRVRPA